MHQLGKAAIKLYMSKCKKFNRQTNVKFKQTSGKNVFTQGILRYNCFPYMFLYASAFNISNIWYVSNYGLDNNDCHSVRTPCKNLQTVLDRATDGADMYVTSHTVSLGMIIKPSRHYGNCCRVESSISYTITTYNETYFTPTCGKLNYIIYYNSF